MTIVKKEVIPAQNGKFVTKVTLENGIVGWVASDVPLKALEGLKRKLERSLAQIEKREMRQTK